MISLLYDFAVYVKKKCIGPKKLNVISKHVYKKDFLDILQIEIGALNRVFSRNALNKNTEN